MAILMKVLGEKCLKLTLIINRWINKRFTEKCHETTENGKSSMSLHTKFNNFLLRDKKIYGYFEVRVLGENLLLLVKESDPCLVSVPCEKRI